MRRILMALALLVACDNTSVMADQQAACQTRIVSTCFSPNGGCEAMLAGYITHATTRVLFEDYYFTDPRLASALVTAKKSNKVVQGILDASQLTIQYSVLPTLYAAGIQTKIDHQHKTFHNKVWLIDSMICTGSFNSTKTADTSNAENMICVVDPTTLKTYEANYALHDAHSDPYMGPNIPVDAGTPE